MKRSACLLLIVGFLLVPGLSYPSSAEFVTGYAKYRLGKFKEAKAYFEKVRLPLVGDHVSYFLAESCLRLKLDGYATENFKKVIDDYHDSVWRIQALLGLARADLDAGRYSEALSRLSDLKPDASIGLTAARLDLLRASALEGLGMEDEAADLLRKIYFDAESPASMDEALRRLKGMRAPRAGEALDFINTNGGQIQLAEQLIRRQRFQEGLEIFRRLMGGRPDMYMKEMLADACFRARDYKEAKGLYAELAEGKRGAEALHFLLRLAKSAARTDDFDTAIDTYKKIIKEYSGGGSRPLYIYKLGFLYMDSGRYDKARDTFLELVDSGYRGYLRRDALWNLAWCNYRLGLLDDTLRYFEKVGGFGRGLQMQALYWSAVCHEKLGSLEAAKAIYYKLLREDRFGYYGFLASRRLYNKEGIPSDWMKDEGGPDPSEVQGSALPAALSKTEFLADLGLTDLGLLEIQRFDRRNIKGEGEVASFIGLARRVGAWRSAHLVAMERFKNLFPQFPYTRGLRAFAWENSYIQAYPAIVGMNSKKWRVDELLVYSIMMEESRYNPVAVSRAGAVGLMQIIPSTGARLAKELGYGPFESADLYRPEVNIRFGVKYLDDLSRMFGGEKAYIIASYNAGEEAVGRWIRGSEAENMEEFIEEIPYDETNAYVKKVLRTYWIYKGLY